MEDEKMKIQFINSRYEELFRINDGESIEIRYPNGEKIRERMHFPR